MRSRRSPQGINTLQMLAADCWGAVDLRYGVDEGFGDLAVLAGRDGPADDVAAVDVRMT